MILPQEKERMIK